MSTFNIKNIFITGASGKIGRNLIPELVKEGYNVRALRFQTPLDFDGVEEVTGSVSDASFVKEALEDIDAVCHLATCKEDKDNFLDVSVKGTFNLLDESRKCSHIKQFILASGDAALGIFFYPNPEPLTERFPLRAYPGYYAFSKVLEETMCDQYHIQYGLPATTLRFSWIYDEDDILAYMTLKEPNFGGPAWEEIAQTDEQKAYFKEAKDGAGCLLHPNGAPYKRHIVGIEDVVQSFLAVLGNSHAVGETFNIAAPSAFSYDALSRYIAEKLTIPVVDFELDGFHDFSIDITKARSMLGYKPGYDVFQIVDKAIDFRKEGKERSSVKYIG